MSGPKIGCGVPRTCQCLCSTTDTKCIEDKNHCNDHDSGCHMRCH